MRILIPSSHADNARLPLLVDVMLKLGGLHNHEVMLVPTASVRDVAEAQADRLRFICPSVFVEAMDTDPPYGWFTAPNMQFYFAMMKLHWQGYRGAVFWNEIDCVPITPGCWDALAAEWVAQGKPFCGCVVDTPFRTPDGRVLNQANDRMMMGCGIYPNGMPTDELIKPLFADLGKGPPYAADQPWDVYLRWVLNRRGVAHTYLIGDMWNTCNYRREGGNIICDAAPSRFTGRARGGVVNSRNVVVHGCKDESLYRLMLNDAEETPLGPNDDNLFSPDGPVGVGDPLSHSTVGAQGPEEDDILGDSTPPPPAPVPAPEPESPPIVVLEKHLIKAGKTRVGDVAKATGLTREQVTALLPLIGYSIKGPGWIVKKETRGRKAKV